MLRSGLADSQKAWSMNLAAEHGCYARRAQPLRERKEVIIQVPAAAGQWQLIGKPDGELDRQQAVYGSHYRRSHCLSVVEEAAQPDLTGTSSSVPAGQPRHHAETDRARRAAVQRGHASIFVSAAV
jgi:hypothetical protein